jgi:hypothetical protein
MHEHDIIIYSYIYEVSAPMAPWSFDVKFPLGIQFTFGSLTFVAGEDGDLKMLPPGTALEHPAPSSTSGST